MTRALIKDSKPQITFHPRKDYGLLKLKVLKSKRLMKRYIVKKTNKHFKRIMLSVKDISIRKGSKLVCINRWNGTVLQAPYVVGSYTETAQQKKRPNSPHKKPPNKPHLRNF